MKEQDRLFIVVETLESQIAMLSPIVEDLRAEDNGGNTDMAEYWYRPCTQRACSDLSYLRRDLRFTMRDFDAAVHHDY